MAHKDIRIQFEIEGRRYEAVGFLDENEPSGVNGYEMLKRTAEENGGAIGDKDEVFLSEHRDQILSRDCMEGYRLVTGKHCPSDLQRVSYFTFVHNSRCRGWYQNWDCLRWHYGINDLVVRRLP